MVYEFKFYIDIEIIRLSLFILFSRLLEVFDREDGGVWRGGGLYS